VVIDLTTNAGNVEKLGGKRVGKLFDGLKDKYTGLPQYGSPKNFAVA